MSEQRTIEQVADLPKYSKEYDAAWAAVMADPKLERARRVLSAHELRLIIAHVGKAFVESLVAI